MKNKKVRVVCMCIVAAIAIGVGAWFAYRANPSFAALLLPGPSTRVLFIGNSFTAVNDLPHTFEEVAASLGKRVEYGQADPGGYKLSDHARDPATLAAIRAKAWDDVVLQEQSQLPSFSSSQVSQQMTSYAVALAAAIHAANPSANVVLYETWGYENGDAQNCPFDSGVCTYAGMQDRIITAYAALAERLPALLAPVGKAWSEVRALHPAIGLYASDGIHPSLAGTYLAACAMYATIFHASVEGAAPLGLAASDAQTLQQVADAAVLGTPK